VATLATVDVAPGNRGRSAGQFLVPLCVLVALVRATYVARPLRNDEGG
jgi:hypothetical protein